MENKIVDGWMKWMNSIIIQVSVHNQIPANVTKLLKKKFYFNYIYFILKTINTSPTIIS